ncbi:MAG: hypothetical protein ABI808_04485 [Pseudonocardiales bacterium]
MSSPTPSVVGFAAWVVAGVAVCLGVLSGFSIGVFVLPAALVFVTVLLALPHTRNSAALGLVSGLGLVPGYVAYLNRHGPGEVCTSTATSSTCADEWSPWPWLVAGVLLVGTGVALFTERRRRAGRGRPAHAR